MQKVRWVFGDLALVALIGMSVGLEKGWVFAAPAETPPTSGQTQGASAAESPGESSAQPASQPTPSPAEEKSQDSSPAVSPEELEKLVQQLDADSFAERQKASQRLSELGRSAIDALVRAATSESLEANVRALDILKRHLDAQDKQLVDAAKQALEKIAASDRAPSARRAKDILKAQEEREKLAQLPLQAGNVPARIQVIAKAQMIEGKAGLRVQVVGNVKTIEGEDDQGKFRIVEDPKEGITVEWTRKKDGKEVTEKVQAKDAEELSKKHPEAYNLYKRHSQAGGIMIQARPMGVAQVQVAPAQVVRRNNVEMASRQLPMWINLVERLVTDEAIKDSSKESLEALKKTSEEARQALEKLEKRLQQAIEQKNKESQENQQEKQSESEKSS